MHTDRCGNTRGQECANGSGKDDKIQEFTYTDTTNVEHETYDYTGTNLSHWNSNKRFKEKFGSHIRKTFKDSLQKTAVPGTSHIIRKEPQSETGSLSGGDHRWFRRSTRKKRPVTRDNNNSNMIIIMAASSRFTYAMHFSVRIPSGFPWVVRMIDRITPRKTGLFSVRN